MPQVKPEIETFAKIKVVGVGGSGGAAVDRMVKSGIRGVEFIVMNTDVQALHHNSAPHKLHIGKTITRGLGAGMNPEMGKRSAEEAQNEIREMIKDSDMVFITCGLGGGTGSGASPVIAEIARDMGALTVAVVTKPFEFEGPQRERIADGAYQALAKCVDTIITIPNERVFQIIEKNTSILDAFKIVDEVLQHGVQGISELITVPGLINVDFADVKAIMANQGSALMGIGTGTGEDRAAIAAKAAVSSPLLELSIDGAQGILFTITGGNTLGMQEVSEAAKIITSSADEDVRVIFGAVIDETMGEDLRITVIATGFDEDHEPRSMESLMEDKPRPSFANTRPKGLYSGTGFKKRPNREEETEEEEEEVEPERPKRTFSSFTRKKADHEPLAPVREKPAPPVSRKIEPPVAAMPITPEVDEDEEEDLEIPAFIRKKMGM
ncbi:MAG: cell division protein FtsZ [Candidatus Magasanikbacteria bacterium]|jgi:cell division protein FtsZ|nr:cell division protein FtsZ [Candidatus Magasanikbacteria bacterium]